MTNHDVSHYKINIVAIVFLIVSVTIACSFRPSTTEIGLTPTLPSPESAACTDDESREFQQLYQERQEQGFDLTPVDELVKSYEKACLNHNFIEAGEVIDIIFETLEQMTMQSTALGGLQESSSPAIATPIPSLAGPSNTPAATVNSTTIPTLFSGNSQWPQVGFDAGNTGQSPYSGPQTNKVKWSFPLRVSGNSAVIGPDGTVYVGTNGPYTEVESRLYALNPDGSEKWSFRVPKLSAQLPDRPLDSWYTANGMTPDDWQKELQEIASDNQLETAIAGLALGGDGTIYFGQKLWRNGPWFIELESAEERYFFALNPDGSEKWRFSVGAADVVTHPKVDNRGTIYFGTAKGYWPAYERTLYALNPDGTKQWSRTLSPGLISTPAIGPDGTVYVGGHKLQALNPTDGSVQWQLDIVTLFSIFGPAVGPDGTVYVTTSADFEDGQLYAITPEGQVKWSQEFGFSEMTPAIAAEGTIYAHTWGNKDKGIEAGLYAFQPDGSLRWSFTVKDGYTVPNWHPAVGWRGSPGGSDSSPIISNDGVIYFGSDQGVVYAVNNRGELVWTFEVGGEFDNRPALDQNGTLYICHAGGVGENRYGGPLKCYAISDQGQLYQPNCYEQCLANGEPQSECRRACGRPD